MMDQATLLRDTEVFLHGKIPLTKAMGVRVESFDAKELRLSAPLALNHNRLGTGFGGSLAGLATLAGYTLLWLELGERSSHIVIKDSQIRYLAPVTVDLVAVAARLERAALEAFRREYAEKGKAGIRLQVTVPGAGQTGVSFSGTFVALRSEGAVGSAAATV